MKRWLARTLRGVVARLASPVTDRIEAVARDTRDVRAILAEVEARLAALAAQEERTRRELADTASRDMGALVRMLSAIEARLDEVHDQLRADGHDAEPHLGDADRAAGPMSRYVIFLGAELGDGDGRQAAALLRVLRLGLDRLAGAGNGAEIWIEHHRVRAEAGGRISPKAHSRVLRGGTAFVEVLRPADALAVRQALDHNGRSDVQVVYCCLSAAPPEPEREALRQALARADHWIFASQDQCRTVQASCGSPGGTRAPERIHIHAVPDPAATDALAVARAYRASVDQVMDRSANAGERHG